MGQSYMYDSKFVPNLGSCNSTIIQYMQRHVTLKGKALHQHQKYFFMVNS